MPVIESHMKTARNGRAVFSDPYIFALRPLRGAFPGRNDMKHTKQILALLLAAAMLLCLAACGRSESDGSESGKSDGRKKTNETPVPEFVYKANYAPINMDNDRMDFYPRLVTEDGFYCISSEVVGQRELYEGEVLQWDGQLDIYENRLYRLGVDGSFSRLEGYEPMKLEVEEGHEFSGGIGCMTKLPDGFLCQENSYESWSDSSAERYSDAWYESYQSVEHFFLRRLDESGRELSCVEMDVDDMMQNGGYVSFSSIVALNEHEALLAGDSGLFIYDIDTGKMTGKISGVDWAQTMLTLHDGRVAVAYYGDDGQKLSIIDTEKKALGDTYSVQGDLYQMVAGGGDYDFYYNNGVNFFGYKLETQTADKLFNWINCDVDNSNVNGYAVTGEGKVIALSSEWDEKAEKNNTSLITMEKVPSSSLPQKEVLTLAVQYLDWEVRSQIINFNRKHDSVRIEVQDYSEYNTEEDYEAGMTKLRTEMLAGNCPDIIYLNGLPAKQLAAKGLLADLYPLIDADPELSREDFFPAVLKAMENNGRLYSTCSSFEIVSAVGASRVVGSEPGWTYADLMAALQEMPEGCTVFSTGETRYDILQMCLMLDMDHFVDWNTGKVSFDSPEFIDLLNFAKNFPAEFDWENYEWTEEDNDDVRIREGRQLLMYGDLNNFDSISQYENIFGGLDAFTFVGFPTSEGVGNMIMTQSGYGISEKCSNKEAAWEFVRTFMTEEYQENNSWNFPSNIHSYEAKKADAMKPTYVKDANGNIQLDPETGEKMMEQKGGYWDNTTQEYIPTYFYTEEEIAKIESVINDTDRVYAVDEAINEIVREQVEAFFAGQRSAEDVAKLIQSKAMIYVNEQR